MAWTLNGVTIHPDDRQDVIERTANYALQDILDATTNVITYFGGRSQQRNITFILFENENGGTGRSNLEAATVADANVNLTSDQGSQGNYRIMDFRSTRRQALNYTQPVWECTAKLVSSA